MHLRSSPCLQRHSAFTLVDVLGAVLVIGVAMGGVFAANTGGLQMLKSAKQATIASKCLQHRIEQIRNYNWTQVTDAQAINAIYQKLPLYPEDGTVPQSTINDLLPGFAEQVTISPYTAPMPGATQRAPAPPFLRLVRKADGTVPAVSDPVLADGTDLVEQLAVRVDVQITWPGVGGRTRTRETSFVIANGGLGR